MDLFGNLTLILNRGNQGSRFVYFQRPVNPKLSIFESGMCHDKSPY